MSNRHVLFQVVMRVFIVAACFFISNDAMAAYTAVTLSTLKTNIDNGITNILKIIQDVSTISGVGFVLSSFFKFHQHKMNPTQIPLSQGVTLLAIGSALMVFPHLIGTVSKGVFGFTAGQGKVTGIVGSGS
jgi:intracellular multiplication protein IcmD